MATRRLKHLSDVRGATPEDTQGGAVLLTEVGQTDPPTYDVVVEQVDGATSNIVGTLEQITDDSARTKRALAVLNAELQALLAAETPNEAAITDKKLEIVLQAKVCSDHGYALALVAVKQATEEN